MGLAGKSYSDTTLGFKIAFNFRDGPFFSLIFFVTVYHFNRMQVSARWFPIGCLMISFGALLRLLELLVLNGNWGTSMVQGYVVGTYFFGIGTSLIALSNTKLLRSSQVASIGPLVLGIYALHFIFIALLRPLDNLYSGIVTWDILYIIMVFLLSSMLALIFSRNDFTKRLVV